MIGKLEMNDALNSFGYAAEITNELIFPEVIAGKNGFLRSKVIWHA